MELDWERQQPPRTLSLKEISRLTEGSGIHPVHAVLIQEGLANTNYRLEDASGRPYHFRYVQREPQNLLTEVAIMQEMSATMPVPKVLFVSAADGVYVSEWVAGTSLQKAEAAGDRKAALTVGRQLGQLLAVLAGKKFPNAGFLNEKLEVSSPWPSVYDGLRGFLDHVIRTDNCRARASIPMLDRVQRSWDRFEAPIREATTHPCLSHADFKPSNILVDRGRVSALLDWEFAHSGTWLLDAGQVLRYEGGISSELVAEIEKGFAISHFVAPHNWQIMATLIDTANLCDFLSRENLSDGPLSAILRLLADELELVESGPP